MIRPGEIVVDLFAGGGGESEGIRGAIRRPVDIAVNHSRAAIAMHSANHPETRHYREDVWEVPPREACGSRPVALLWASPDCTHFSRAKGTAPKSRGTRALASVVIRWARDLPAWQRPRVILLENVEEFQTWGPLGEDGQPIAARAGEDFRAWLGALADLGYRVEYRLLVAADYGAPTTRKRLFLVARCDGRPIVWPDPSHGSTTFNPWRPASDVIDWTLACPSIFERSRPLAEATLRRIAAGIRRFVIEAAEPFIIPVTHQGDARAHAIGEPVRTITAAHRGELALVAPSLIQTGYGERPGQRPRALDLEQPLGTVVACGAKHGLVAAFLSKHYGGVVGHGVQRPLGTVTTVDHHSLSTAFLTKFYGTATGAPCSSPLPTVTSGGAKGGGHLAAVRAFLIKYYGAAAGQQQALSDPLHTVTTRARFGLVTVAGEQYRIADIGMRMLQPHELFAAQGFPSTYDITCESTAGRRLTKTEQITLAGNSVPPAVARALVRANLFGQRSATA